ncbi:MAG TPA: diguanylate cyclase [Terracidiphilus sp.]|nr:diguanylate cyclase [Terracidiphilus sp.]
MTFGLARPVQRARGLLCGLALLCLATVCTAQRYTFRAFHSGLGNLNITSIAQDRTGYLWAGTENGLYRYDGSQFLRFGANAGLTGRTIQDVFVSPDGTLWAGTTTGLFFLRHDGIFAEVRPPDGDGRLSLQAGTTLAARMPDKVVAATRRGAFLIRRTGAEAWTAQPMNLLGENIWSVLYGPQGALWYGCDNDLCRLTGGKSERMGAALGLPPDTWMHTLEAHDGHIWMRGLRHVGELDVSSNKFHLHDLPGQSSLRPDQALAQDGRGRIIASQGGELGIWENGAWRMVMSRNGLPQMDISQLFTDRDGSFWIGLVGHGLLMWLGEDRWVSYTAADGLSDDTVWATARDKLGRLWIGTDSGLNYLSPGSTEPKSWRQPGIQSSRAVALQVSRDGAIWLGSAAGSVTRIDPTTLRGTSWKIPEVYRFLLDRPDRLWVATGHGLFLINPLAADKAPRLVTSPALQNPGQRFTNLCRGPHQTVWAAGDLGVFRMGPDGWHHIDPAGSGLSPDVIAFDLQGNLWAAGPSRPLMKLQVRGDRVTNFERMGQPPLLSQQVVALMVDHQGWIWVGQDAGVSVYNGQSWQNFTQDDGLYWNDVDSDALMEDADGSIWIGTSGGLSHFLHPGAAPAGPMRTPVFSSVQYGTMELHNGATTKWQGNPLVISVASLSFQDSRDNGIKYRLEGGQGGGWEVSRELTVRYRHLVPGNYRFEAMSIDANGNQLSPVAVYRFHIQDRWWQYRMVQFALSLLLACLALLLWRWRVDHLLRQKRQLEIAVLDRTEDLVQEKAELVKTRDQMRHFAEHDDLTGLWNHRIIVDRLQREVERSRREGQPLSIILIDLDHFKRINDTYGHMAGDEVLRCASAIFQSKVRNYDWVGRYGGEEFLLILPGSGFKNACERAEDLRLALEEARIVEGKSTIPVTASFGVASGFVTTHDELLRVADQALYSAKDQGRNCVVSVEVDSRRRVQREILSGELR